MSATTNSLFPTPPSETIAKGIVNSTFHAATGALAAHLFTSIHPIGGAVFGFSQKVSSAVLAKGLDKFFGTSKSEEIVKFAAHFFGSILAALTVTSLIGYHVAFSSGILLTLAMIPVVFITTIGLSCLSGIAKDASSS